MGMSITHVLGSENRLTILEQGVATALSFGMSAQFWRSFVSRFGFGAKGIDQKH